MVLHLQRRPGAECRHDHRLVHQLGVHAPDEPRNLHQRDQLGQHRHRVRTAEYSRGGGRGRRGVRPRGVARVSRPQTRLSHIRERRRPLAHRARAGVHHREQGRAVRSTVGVLRGSRDAVRHRSDTQQRDVLRGGAEQAAVRQRRHRDVLPKHGARAVRGAGVARAGEGRGRARVLPGRADSVTVDVLDVLVEDGMDVRSVERERLEDGVYQLPAGVSEGVGGDRGGAGEGQNGAEGGAEGQGVALTDREESGEHGQGRGRGQFNPRERISIGCGERAKGCAAAQADGRSRRRRELLGLSLDPDAAGSLTYKVRAGSRARGD